MPRRFFPVLLVLLALAVAGSAQRSDPEFAAPRTINGQVRLDGHPAPQGVLVLLDFAAMGGEVPASPGELARTSTDSSGRFVLDHLESIGTNNGKQAFAVTAHYPGYKNAHAIVDLTFSPRAFVTIELRRDTSHDMPNVPPNGAADIISAKQPISPEAQELLARGEELLLQKHDPKDSIDDFRKVLKLEPKYGPGYLLLGTAYMQTQSWTDAEEAFEKAANIEPMNADAFVGIGAALNQQHDFIGAQKPLQHSLELKPDSAEGNYELARSLWAVGRWQDAEPHVRKAIEVNKAYASPHVLMGNIYLRHRDAPSALAEFQQYLRLEPEGPQAQAVRDIVGRIEKALTQE